MNAEVPPDESTVDSEPTTTLRCPTPTAHKRLNEGHRWWHGCLENYDDPPAFQANLNACLQALRNVTWALQKEKNLIRGFDSWYPVKQDQMRVDPLMAWLVKSRNRVVKSTDLELLSTATMRLMLQYADVASAVSESLPDSKRESVKTIPAGTRPSEYYKFLGSIPSRVLAQSSLLIERRWVDKALPDVELLDALAHCYGILAQILFEAHRRAKIEFQESISDDQGAHAPNSELEHNGRLPCMVTTLNLRTTQYRMGDDEPLMAEYRRLRTPEITPRQIKRYGLEQFNSDLSQDHDSIFDFMNPLMAQAKRFLQVDKYHIFVIFLFKDGNPLNIQSAVLRDRASKFALSRELASQVAANGVDGIITVGEIWHSGMVVDEEGAIIPPGEVPDRKEGLQVYAEIREGEYRSKVCFFHRRFGRIQFDNELNITEGSLENNFMAPIRAVWRREGSAVDGSRETEGNRE